MQKDSRISTPLNLAGVEINLNDRLGEKVSIEGETTINRLAYAVCHSGDKEASPKQS